MEPVRIDDPQDLRVAAYLDIRERDLAGRQGRFVAEGKVVLDLLLSAGRFAAESVLVLENRLAGLEDILRKAPADVPVYLAAGAVMDAIAGFHMHRGILAIGRKGTPQSAEALLDTLPARALVVVLVGIANHDNMGSIFRNAAAFGADAVLMDATCCDPLYRKAIRVSVGAALKIPFASFADANGFTAMLAQRGFEQFALSPRGQVDIRAVRPSERLALYLGTEGEGLPESLLARLHAVRITMSEGFDSLNVAAASAIALHHFSLLLMDVVAKVVAVFTTVTTRVVPVSLGTTSILKVSISSANGTGAPVDFDRASRVISAALSNDVASSNSAKSTG